MAVLPEESRLPAHDLPLPKRATLKQIFVEAYSWKQTRSQFILQRDPAHTTK
jgi:hypothetical protein